LRPNREKHDVGGINNALVITSNSDAMMKRRQSSRNLSIARRHRNALKVAPCLDQASDDALRDGTRSDKAQFHPDLLSEVAGSRRVVPALVSSWSVELHLVL
jgi:hypothetical protein